MLDAGLAHRLMLDAFPVDTDLVIHNLRGSITPPGVPVPVVPFLMPRTTTDGPVGARYWLWRGTYAQQSRAYREICLKGHIGACTFHGDDGLCEIHNSGFKPRECVESVACRLLKSKEVARDEGVRMIHVTMQSVIKWEKSGSPIIERWKYLINTGANL